MTPLFLSLPSFAAWIALSSVSSCTPGIRLASQSVSSPPVSAVPEPATVSLEVHQKLWSFSETAYGMGGGDKHTSHECYSLGMSLTATRVGDINIAEGIYQTLIFVGNNLHALGIKSNPPLK